MAGIAPRPHSLTRFTLAAAAATVPLMCVSIAELWNWSPDPPEPAPSSSLAHVGTLALPLAIAISAGSVFVIARQLDTPKPLAAFVSAVVSPLLLALCFFGAFFLLLAVRS